MVFIIPFVLIPIQRGSKVAHLIFMLIAKKTAKNDSHVFDGKAQKLVFFSVQSSMYVNPSEA